MLRPDLDPSLPRFTIRYLKGDVWKLSQFKMTELYAAKQYHMTQWEIVPESAEYVKAEDMPLIHSGVMSKIGRTDK
jgi:hypothetical protein